MHTCQGLVTSVLVHQYNCSRQHTLLSRKHDDFICDVILMSIGEEII